MGSRLVLLVVVAAVVAMVVASWALGLALRRLRGLEPGRPRRARRRGP
jgi:hypothetical protein